MSTRMTMLGAVEVGTPSIPSTLDAEPASLAASGPTGEAIVALFHAKTKWAEARKAIGAAEVALNNANQAHTDAVNAVRQAETTLEKLLDGRE